MNHSRMSAPEKPHCSIRNGSAHDDQGERERDLGQPRQLMAARLIEPEPAARASRRPDRRLCWAARASRRGWPDSRARRRSTTMPVSTQLLGDEARERHVAERGPPPTMPRATIHSGSLSQRGGAANRRRPRPRSGLGCRGTNGVSSSPIRRAAKTTLAANDCTTLSASGTKKARLTSVRATSRA